MVLAQCIGTELPSGKSHLQCSCKVSSINWRLCRETVIVLILPLRRREPGAYVKWLQTEESCTSLCKTEWKLLGRLFGTGCFLFLLFVSFFFFFLNSLQSWWFKMVRWHNLSYPAETFPIPPKDHKASYVEGGVLKSSKHCSQSPGVVWKVLPSTWMQTELGGP